MKLTKPIEAERPKKKGKNKTLVTFCKKETKIKQSFKMKLT